MDQKKIPEDRLHNIIVWFVNEDGSDGCFDDGIPDKIVDLIKEGKLTAENCLAEVEAYYEGDSDMENYDYMERIEITGDDEEGIYTNLFTFIYN